MLSCSPPLSRSSANNFKGAGPSKEGPAVFALALEIMVRKLFLLLPPLLIISCTTVPQTLNPKLLYKRDLPFCVKDIGCYEGTAVLPARAAYDFEIAPKGGADIDLLVLDTCHREVTEEVGSQTNLGFFEKIFGKKKQGWKFSYIPIAGLEDDGDCSLRIATYEKSKGRHAWAIVRFEHPKYELEATLVCNGLVTHEKGVSLCQSKAGLAQQIRFSEPVMIEPDLGCAMPVKGTKPGYEWKINLNECGYTVKGQSGKLHDILAIGYEGLLLRGEN